MRHLLVKLELIVGSARGLGPNSAKDLVASPAHGFDNGENDDGRNGDADDVPDELPSPILRVQEAVSC